MVAAQETREAALRTYYAERPSGTLGEFLIAIGVTDTDSVADWIMADANLRCECGQAVSLDDLMPILISRGNDPVLIDTAIDAVVRSGVARGQTESDVLDGLVAAHPHLSQAIQTARALGSLFRSSCKERDPQEHAPPLQLPLSVGPTIASGNARYELIERLGVGSQGEVLLAIDRQLSNADHPAWVAVKVAKHRTRPETQSIETLKSEALRARRVQHPNVVRVSDFGATPDHRAFVVYEHIAGMNLQQWRERHGHQPDQGAVLDFAKQIARGVQGIHAKGLVHGDLKPSNVLVGVDNRLYVADLGLARSLTPATARSVRRSAAVAGTVGFMAPEQLALEEEPGMPADVYALGGLLFWLLTNKAPNGDTADEAIEYLQAEPQQRREIMLRRVEQIEVHDLRMICRRALSPLPDDRYGSADAFHNDLVSIERHEVLQWTNPGSMRRFKLLVRRQPGTVASFAACIAAIVLISVLSIRSHLSHREREWELKNEAVLAEVRDNEVKMELARQTVSHGLKTMRNLKSRNVEDALVHGLAILEVTLGPTFRDIDGHDRELWQTRVEVARNKRIDGTRGTSMTLEAMHWSMLEGMWAAQLGRLQEGLHGSELAVEAFAKLLPESDPWLIRAKGTLAAIVVMVLDESRRGILPPELEGFASEVAEKYPIDALRRDMDAALALENPNHLSTSTVGRFIANSSMRLYAPNWLSEPLKLEQMLNLLKKV